MVSLVERVAILHTTPTRIIGYDPKRTALGLTNLDGANAIWFGADRSVSVATGYPLKAGAGRDFNVGLGDETELELWAIAETATVNVAILVQRSKRWKLVKEGTEE